MILPRRVLASFLIPPRITAESERDDEHHRGGGEYDPRSDHVPAPWTPAEQSRAPDKKVALCLRWHTRSTFACSEAGMESVGRGGSDAKPIVSCSV